MTAALCLDMGGSNLRAALAEEGRADAAAPLGRWPAPKTLDEFREIVASLLNQTGAARLGAALPGLVSGTRCVWMPNLPFLDGQDFCHLFPGEIISLGNDAQMALLAEAEYGAARGVADAILLAIGTGIGSSVMADGRIVRGQNGAALSFGWACADAADGGDETFGWLERHAAGPALDALAARLGLADGKALVASARDGDEGALAALQAPANALGAAIAGAVALLGTRLVIISGGVSDSVDVLSPLISRIMWSHLPPHLRQAEIKAASLGASASLIGAGLAAFSHRIWLERPR